MKPELLSKRRCRKMADAYIARREITGMGAPEIAREIYFHAMVYYICLKLRRFHLPVSYLIDHANPVDLENHPDKLFRRICYRIMWMIPEWKKKKTA